MHEGEVWNQFMRPIVHPSHQVVFLERELTEAHMEIANLKIALADSEKARSKALADLADADHVTDLRDMLEWGGEDLCITRDEEIKHYLGGQLTMDIWG
jgi:hypothetical protein